MSKSKGNVVNPDDIIGDYGADALRMYIMFMGPPELDCEWQDNGLEGTKRFLNKLWNYFTNPKTILHEKETETAAVTQRVNLFLKDYQERLDNFKPNTAISAAMEFLNDATAQDMQLNKESAEAILVSLSIFAPYMTSELLETLFKKSLTDCSWPTYDKKAVDNQPVTIVVQINGKTRIDFGTAKDTPKDIIEKKSKELAAKWLEEKTIVKTIVVPNRLINFVVK